MIYMNNSQLLKETMKKYRINEQKDEKKLQVKPRKNDEKAKETKINKTKN